MTWNAANEKCRDLDHDRVATLTSVNSEAENNFILYHIAPHYLNGVMAWLGGTDEAEEGVWR